MPVFYSMLPRLLRISSVGSASRECVTILVCMFVAWWYTVDSELSMRFPVIYKHLYETKTENDFFISGDSGILSCSPLC